MSTTDTTTTDQRLIGDTERRVWVGCLACYNSGRLHGEWLSPNDAVEWQCDSPSAVIFGLHEETWCFDMEGFPTNREMSPVEALAIHEQMLADDEAGHGIPAAVCQTYRSDYGDDETPADGFMGAADTLRELVEQFYDDGACITANNYDGETADALAALWKLAPELVNMSSIVHNLDVNGNFTGYQHGDTTYWFNA